MTNLKDLQDRVSPKFDSNVVLSFLKKCAGSPIVEIQEIKLGAESKKGDSYLSTITRFSISATKGAENEPFSIDVIVKAYPKNIGRRKTFRSADFFRNEIAFYEKVWPLLMQFQKSKGIDNSFNEVPKVLASYADDDDGFIAMEDLSHDGYVMCPREVGFDVDHAKLIIVLFARFHALSYACREQEKDKIKVAASALTETYIDERCRVWYDKYQQILIGVVKDAITQELDEKYVKKLDSIFKTDFYGKMIDDVKRENKLSVITHGDAWIPNFLLKYDSSKKPVSAKLIDFQLTRYSRLTLDLHFFFYSCLDQDLRCKYFNALLESYCAEFSIFAKSLGSDGSWLTVDIILEDMKEAGYFALGMCMEANVMSLLDDEEVCDIDSIKGDDAIPLDSIWTLQPIKTKVKRARIAEYIRDLIDREFI